MHFKDVHTPVEVGDFVWDAFIVERIRFKMQIIDILNDDFVVVLLSGDPLYEGETIKINTSGLLIIRNFLNRRRI